MTDTEQRVKDFVAYMDDFHEANGDWPTRNDYADFLGLDDSRALPGVRAAINRGLIGYLPGDVLAPRDVVDRDPAKRPT